MKRPLPVPPPMPPMPSAKSDDPIVVSKLDSDGAASSNSGRKQKKRKTKSLERLRDQSDEIELSDSDEDIAIAQKIPSIIARDEPDASATSPSLSDTVNVISNIPADEPAICGDSQTTAIDANTCSDKSQLSYDEILKIEESFDEDGANGILRSIVVDIHAEPTIELRIHESDSDIAIPVSNSGIFNAIKITKDQIKANIELERCFSEDDAIDDDDDDKDKPERLVQSDSEVLSKTPLELVVECDINENVIVSETKPCEIIDLDHNHNDIVKPIETDKSTDTTIESANGETKLVENRESTTIVQPNELPSDSISSRSSFDESDGNEPVYATVDTALNTVSFLFVKIQNHFSEKRIRTNKQKNCSGKKIKSFAVSFHF